MSIMNRHQLIVENYKNWISNNDRVLDVGCGNCIVAEKLNKEIGCEIIGTDILDYCFSRIPFKKMTKENRIPFKDDSFDITMLNDVLHHTDYQKELILECLRVSKKLLIFETKKSLLVRFGDFIASRLVCPKMNTPLNFRTFYEWNELFNRMKLNIKNSKINKPSLQMPVVTFAFLIEK